LLDIEPPFQLLERVPSFAAARKNVNRRVTILRPGVNGHVGFGKQGETRHTVRRELMYVEVDDGEITLPASG